MTPPSELHLMAQIARMYYDQGMTQQQIARKLALSRQKISRLLIRARDQGIVRISIVDPTPTDHTLTIEVKKTFDLQSVVLAKGEGLEGEALRRQIGIAAADHLLGLLEVGQDVGIGWGRTLDATVDAIGGVKQVKVRVIPLLGGIGEMAPSFQVNELARRLAEALGGTYRFLHVPAFTYDQDVWDTLMRTAEVERIAQHWPGVRPAIVGIGQVEFQRIYSMFFAEHVPHNVLEQLEEIGAVGDICGRFFDINGLPLTVGAGVIGISAEVLKELPAVVAVAGGLEKTRAILGALRGGFVTDLVTDTVTARSMLLENTRSP